MRLAVTGTQRAGDAAVDVIRRELLRVGPSVTAFGSGCAVGVDTMWAIAARDLFPDAEHHLFAPAAPSNIEALLMFGGWIVHDCKPGTSNYESYFNRNSEMADWASTMIAHPKNGYERMRGSGTWWTVRIAERLGTPIEIVPLNDGAVVRKHLRAAR